MTPGRFLPIMALSILLGCGGAAAQDSSPRLGREWVDDLRREDWRSACQALLERPRRCETALAADYGGRTIKLLAPGAYASGDDVNDNRTRFAMRVRRPGETTYVWFVVRKKGGRPRIDQEASVTGP